MTDEALNPDALHDHPYYGVDIIRREQQEFVQNLLKKYRGEKVTEELKKKIWDELQMQKHLGTLTIPFKMTTRRDPYGKFPDTIEIILDTKV
jgi:D-lyxose ketol-isomerase